MMSGSATGGPRGLPGGVAGPELISSVSFNTPSLQALDRQRLGHGGRGLIKRGEAPERGASPDGACGPREHGSAAARPTEAFLVAGELIDQGQGQYGRIRHG